MGLSPAKPKPRGPLLRLALIDSRVSLLDILSSHNVPSANSHYKPWRDDFIKAGLQLFELRSDPAIQSTVVDVAPVKAEFAGAGSRHGGHYRARYVR